LNRSNRSMTLADAMQSGTTPARVSYGEALVNASRFIRELGPSAPPTTRRERVYGPLGAR
jgi:hypothetical protein